MNTSLLFSQPDHISIRSSKAEHLYRIFTESLELPVSWPLQDIGFAECAWVTVGNTNLELWAPTANTDLPVPADKPVSPFVHGFSLDPFDIHEAVDALQNQGFECTAPKTFGSRNSSGEEVTACTKADLLSVSSPWCLIFFCEWNKDGLIFPWKEKLTSRERRAIEKQKLRACNGGLLGIEGLYEIRMDVSDLATAHPNWERLTSSMVRAEDSVWDLGGGIGVKLTAANQDKIRTLVFRVRSLDAARSALKKKHMLGTDTKHEISIAPEALCGLDFRFVEAG